jgi:hypothetical protein
MSSSPGVDAGRKMRGSRQAAAELARLIATGVAERELLATVARTSPELTRPEFMAALQDATTAAERRITNARH